MSPLFKNSTEIIRKVLILARPFGLKKLVSVIVVSFLQGFFQVLGVTSIFPFLALAADPGRLRRSELGSQLLEHLPPMDDHRLLLTAGTFAIVMLFVTNGVNLGAEFIRTRYAHDFGHWLRVRLLRQLTARPYTDFLQENSAILVKKIVGDVMNYTIGVLLPLLDSIARGATIVLLVVTLFFVHPQIAVVATIGLGLFYLVVFRGLGKRRHRISEGIKEAFRGLFLEAQQLLSGIKPVKVHCCEERFIEEFAEHSQRNARLHAWSSILSNTPRYLIEPLAFGALVLAVMVYAARGQDLLAILPNLGVMALAGYRLLPAVQLFYGQVSGLSTALHSLDEVFDEFLATQRTIGKDHSGDSSHFSRGVPLDWRNDLTLENVTFSYPGSEKPIINRLNVIIPKNSSLGIIGTTGCGKSTLVDLILGLHLPTAGRILVDNTPLVSENRRAWRSGIGYVPQEVFLIDDTIRANIAFGVPDSEVDEESLVRAAKAAQILEFIERELPEGFDSVVGERGVRLSGGQRQRIGLARALFHEPELLVLDEATSALDQDTEDEVMSAIAGIQGGITMIVVAHRLRTVSTCDKLLNLGEVSHNTNIETTTVGQ